jgi:phage terminase small subunit
MAPRGRKPKPDALKKLQGNPGKRKIAKASQDQAEATSPLGALAPPASLTDAERKIWESQIGALEQLKFVRVSDLRAFTRFVKMQALFDAVAPMVTAENLVEITVSDKVTMERLNKRFLAMLHLDKRLLDYDQQFGTTPAVRQAMMSRLAARAPQLPLGDQPSKPADSAPTPSAPEPPPPPARPASPVGFGRLN